MIEDSHTSLVAAAVVGRQLGVAKQATVWAGAYHWTGAYEGEVWPLGMFHMLELFVNILERVSREGLGESSVINISFVVEVGTDPVFHHLMVPVSKSSLPNPSTFPTKSPHDAKVARGSAPADNVPAKTLCELAELGVVIVGLRATTGIASCLGRSGPSFLLTRLLSTMTGKIWSTKRMNRVRPQDFFAHLTYPGTWKCRPSDAETC